MMEKARLEEIYEKEIRSKLKKSLGLKNIMEVPKISKIAGQQPVRTVAKKSIAGFKLREGMPIGVKVTLRRKRMYEFLDRLINLALPKVRDFQGVSTKLDRRGNYNLGVKEWLIFPEIDFEMSEKMYGLNITIHTTAHSDDHAF